MMEVMLVVVVDVGRWRQPVHNCAEGVSRPNKQYKMSKKYTFRFVSSTGRINK